MERTLRPVLVAPLPAQDRRLVLLAGLAARHRHAPLQGVLVAELEERAEPAGGERMTQARPAEGSLVVAVEDPGERFEVEGEVGNECDLDALFFQPFAAEEVAQGVGAVDPGQIVLVDLVRVAETVAHLAEPRLSAERQREERQVRLGQAHAGIGAPRFLAGLDPHDRRGVRVYLAEERELDLAWEEAVLLAGERTAARPLDVARGDVADEVARDAHIEQELT